MARPKKEIDLHQLKSLMRLQPTLEDTANFFSMSQRQIERIIRKEHNLSFVEFREQNMVHTRLALKRKMIDKALAGDNTCLIWTSKNLLGWSDKVEQKVETNQPIENKIVYTVAWGGIASDNGKKTDT